MTLQESFERQSQAVPESFVPLAQTAFFAGVGAVLFLLLDNPEAIKAVRQEYLDFVATATQPIQ